MRALVTGGAGYVGSVVAAQLLDAGHEVVVLDDLRRGHRAAIPPGATPPGARRSTTPMPSRNGSAAASMRCSTSPRCRSSRSPSSIPSATGATTSAARCNLLDAMRDPRHRAARLLLDRGHLRGAGDGPDHRGPAAGAGQRLRRLEARRRPDDPRRVRRPRARRRLAALLQRRGRERRAGRGPRPRDAPDPARPPGGRRTPARDHDLRDRLRHARRDRGARLHPRRRPGRRPPARARPARARPPPDLQPRHRRRLDGARGDRGRARASPAARSRSRRPAGAPATRRS